jgi:putative heme-binding domain-containing protein
MAKVARQSPKQIFQKIIVVPHRSADPAYRTRRLTTKTGSILTGIKSGETADAVFFYDTSSLPPMLRTIPKADIAASAPHHGSVMPDDYASRLTLQQLLDVVAFLKQAGGDHAATVTLADVAN